MSKELEALEVIEDERYSLPILGDFDDAVKIIRQALTPPTAEEVCEALSEWFKKSKYHSYIDTVFYSEKGKYFYTEGEKISLIEMIFDNYYIHQIPPHLITMIGKFYESLEGEKWAKQKILTL